MVKSLVKYCFLFFACQLVGFHAFSQNVKVDSLRNSAKYLFDKGEYAAALPYSEKLLALFPADGRYLYQTGVCLSEVTLDLSRAYHLLKGASLKEVPAEVYFYLGDVCRRQYRFDEAIDWFRQYMVVGGGKEFSSKVVERQVSMCETGQYLTKYATNLRVLGRAKTSKDSLLYYYTVAPGSGQLGLMPQELISKVDKKNTPVAPLAVYYPSAEGGEPEVIYFSSFGKTDSHGMNLWKTTKTSAAEWEQPAELSGPLNSDGDDVFPMPAPNGSVLYFASNSLYGMGGYDIFKTTLDSVSGKWSMPENLGFPINSPADDFFFVLDKDGETAMFASNRDAASDSVIVYKVVVPKNGINQSLTDIAEIVSLAKLSIFKGEVGKGGGVSEKKKDSPKARVEGMQYNLTYMGLISSLFAMRNSQDSMQAQLDNLRTTFQQETESAKADSLRGMIVGLEERQRNVSAQIVAVNKEATAMEEAFLSQKNSDAEVSAEVQEARCGFLFDKQVVGFFGKDRIAALRRLWSAAEKLDSSFYGCLELLRQEQDLETMLTATDKPEVIQKINQSLAEVRSKTLILPSEFLSKRTLLSAGLHNLIKERLLLESKDSVQSMGFQAANADMVSAQGIFNNNMSDSPTLEAYEGIRDGLWVEERGLLRYKLVVTQILNLNGADSLKQRIQGLEHRSSIPFYVFEQPKPKVIVPSLKPSSKPIVTKSVKLKQDYSVGLSVVDPYPYSSENPIPFDQPIPAGVVYKIQLGAFSQPITFLMFKGLAPISGENLKGGTIKKYYAGIFYTLVEAQAGLVLAKSRGLTDAFLVGWLNGKVVPLARAQNFEERKTETGKAVQQKAGELSTAVDKYIFRVIIGTFDGALPPRVQVILDEYAKGKEVAKKVIDDSAASYSVGNFVNFEEALRLKDALLSGGFVEAYITTVIVKD